MRDLTGKQGLSADKLQVREPSIFIGYKISWRLFSRAAEAVVIVVIGTQSRLADALSHRFEGSPGTLERLDFCSGIFPGVARLLDDAEDEEEDNSEHAGRNHQLDYCESPAKSGWGEKGASHDLSRTDDAKS